jgi:hypothetical protein
MKKASSYPLARGNTRNYLQKGKGMITNRPLFVTTVIVFFIFTTAGVVAKTVKIGGKDAKLDLPSNAKASLVLLPGNAGLSDRDPLQRARMKYVENGNSGCDEVFIRNRETRFYRGSKFRCNQVSRSNRRTLVPGKESGPRIGQSGFRARESRQSQSITANARHSSPFRQMFKDLAETGG